MTTQTPLLSTALNDYEKRVAVNHRGYEAERYRIDILRRSTLGRIEIAKITPDLIRDYRDKRLQIVSSGTVRRELGLLRSVYTQLPELGFAIAGNPVKNVKLPPDSKARDRILSEKESEDLWREIKAYSNLEIYRICVRAYETGNRRGALLNMCKSDIDLDNNLYIVEFDKNGEPHYSPLSPLAKQIIQEQWHETHEDKLFSISKEGFKAAWRRILKLAGVENFRFHDIRHYTVTKLIAEGHSLAVVGARTNHKDLQSQRRYINLTRRKFASDMAKAIENEPPILPIKK